MPDLGDGGEIEDEAVILRVGERRGLGFGAREGPGVRGLKQVCPLGVGRVHLVGHHIVPARISRLMSPPMRRSPIMPSCIV